MAGCALGFAVVAGFLVDSLGSDAVGGAVMGGVSLFFFIFAMASWASSSFLTGMRVARKMDFLISSSFWKVALGAMYGMSMAFTPFLLIVPWEKRS